MRERAGGSKGSTSAAGQELQPALSAACPDTLVVATEGVSRSAALEQPATTLRPEPPSTGATGSARPSRYVYWTSSSIDASAVLLLWGFTGPRSALEEELATAHDSYVWPKIPHARHCGVKHSLLKCPVSLHRKHRGLRPGIRTSNSNFSFVLGLMMLNVWGISSLTLSIPNDGSPLVSLRNLSLYSFRKRWTALCRSPLTH